MNISLLCCRRPLQGGLRCGNEGVGRRLELAKENGDFVIIVIIVIVFIVFWHDCHIGHHIDDSQRTVSIVKIDNIVVALTSLPQHMLDIYRAVNNNDIVKIP